MKKNKPGGNGGCAFIQSHLISIAERTVTNAAFSGVQDHLSSCPECASLVRQVSRAWENPAPAEDARPSPSFFPGLMARIEAGEKLRPGGRRALAMAWRILRPAAVAAIFLSAIFVGHEMGKAGKPLPSPNEPFADRLVDNFENIPRGSVADFYVNRQNSTKEDLE